MVIQVGDKIPEFTFHTLEDGKPTPVSTTSILPGKKVVLFAGLLSATIAFLPIF